MRISPCGLSLNPTSFRLPEIVTKSAEIFPGRKRQVYTCTNTHTVILCAVTQSCYPPSRPTFLIFPSTPSHVSQITLLNSKLCYALHHQDTFRGLSTVCMHLGLASATAYIPIAQTRDNLGSLRFCDRVSGVFTESSVRSLCLLPLGGEGKR